MCEGAWWEVEVGVLGEAIAVSRVTIFNRIDGPTSSRLSNSHVSLLDYQGNTLKSYRIGDSTGIAVFNISFAGNNGTLINIL